MISAPAIANAGPRDWRSNGGFRDLAGGCVRAKAVKRHATRRAKAEEEREAPAAVGSPTRVCADCGTSETPLWRSGPAGPKSLCNACGIKYRKRKKALEPASRSSDAGSDGQAREEPSPEELKKRQRLKQERMLKLLLLQHEKQRGGREEEKKATVEEHGKEEVEEAALLLMSLSSGLVLHSYLRLHFQAPDLSLSGSSDPGTNPEESSPEPDDAAAGGEGPQRRVPFHRSLENGHDQGFYKGILVGKVGQNPVQKYLRSGRPVVLFSLGTGGIRNNRRPLDNVEPRDYADRCSVQWHRVCVYPDRLGNLALKHVKLGSILYVEENLETKVFTDQLVD